MGPTAPDAKKPPTTALSIVALVLGVVAFLAGGVPILGPIIALTVTIIAIVAVAKTVRRAMPIAGMILSSIGLIIGVVTTVLLVVALLGNTSNPNANASNDTWTNDHPSPQVGELVGDSEIDAAIDGAVWVLDTFWSENFSHYYPGRSYEAPRVGGAYTSDRPPSCGGEELVPSNAFYCRTDHTLWWDAELMKAGHGAGDAVVWLIVAHEWGHAIQAQNDDVWTAKELQADCFAAAALYGAEDDGYFSWEPGDTAEITHALTELADETTWTDVADHGDPLDRIDSFNEGRMYGVEGCYSISD